MRTSIVIVIVGALALGGCASSQADQRPTGPEAKEARTSKPPGMCPMAVEGTTVRGEDVEGGVAVVFTTTGDVAELRRRVAQMAAMHDQQHGEGHGQMMHGGQMGAGMMMPRAAARSEEIDGGARVVLTPQDPAELAPLREHVHQHVERMASGECPMMAMPGRDDEATPQAPADQHIHHVEGGNP